MARHYRALISIQITAEDDEGARRVAAAYMDTLVAPDGQGGGHLELLGQAHDNSMEIARVVWADPHFRHQLPPDWKA
jgi:hypothetical protein